MSRRNTVAGLAIALLLAGCGLKGPLYLPEKSGDVTIRPGPQDGIKPSAPPTATETTPPTTQPTTPEAEPAPPQQAPRGDGGG
jgi:predicted small lipoprotein YifL